MGDRPEYAIGPVGEMLTIETLPSPDTRRWTPHRKAEVVAAISGGLLTFDEARERYSLEMEELINWQRALNRSGIRGLRSPGCSIIATPMKDAMVIDDLKFGSK